MNTFPDCPLTLNPGIANVQLDIEKLDITLPGLTPAPTAMSEIQIAKHSIAAADVEMGEPAILNAQPKDVSSLASPRLNGLNSLI
jgi:hypothetical protein